VQVLASGLDPAEGESRVDGMTCNEDGRIYLTGPGCLWLFTPTDELLGRVLFPGEQLSNLTWMRPGRDTLFVTSRCSIFTVHTAAREARRAPE
jgi:gluconolactonase